eukprot:scaffold312944_cov33-Tisochrysis_lutea.AAC.4
MEGPRAGRLSLLRSQRHSVSEDGMYHRFEQRVEGRSESSLLDREANSPSLTLSLRNLLHCGDLLVERVNGGAHWVGRGGKGKELAHQARRKPLGALVGEQRRVKDRGRHEAW